MTDFGEDRLLLQTSEFERISLASGAMISKSDLGPIVLGPRVTFCTSPQTFVTVPFFS